MDTLMDPGTRLPTESPSRRVVALATRNDADRTTGILVGRYGCGKSGKWCGPARPCPKPSDPKDGGALWMPKEEGGPPIAVRIDVEDFAWGAEAVAEILHIPGTGAEAPLTTPATESRRLSVAAGRVSVMLPGFQDGASAYVRLSVP